MQHVPALDWAEIYCATIDRMNNSMGAQSILFISRSPFRSNVFVLGVKVFTYRGRLTECQLSDTENTNTVCARYLRT